MRYLLIIFILSVPALLHAEAEISQSARSLLRSTNTWTATQNFNNITVNSCTGCGSGGSSSEVSWEIDANFIGPNLPGANPLKFKSLLVEGNLYILNAYGTLDE